MLNLVVLGIVQGLTEFLPISSTAHLLFAEHYLGIQRPGLVLEAVLHLGTVAAALVMFWPDVVRLGRGFFGLFARRAAARGSPAAAYGRAALAILVATLVTGALGLIFEKPLERMFASVRGTAYQLIVTGLILLWHRERGKRTVAEASLGDGAALGVSQALAIIPGISRSGTTIVTGLGLGFERTEAARLSFLMAIPAVLGAAVFSLKDAAKAASLGYTPAELVVGGIVAAVVGAMSIAWLLSLVKRGRLVIFTVYCIVVGLLVLATTR